MQNAWNGYVFALISSFVCGSISTGWYYLGGFEFLVGGQDLEEAKHLATDMGAVPGVVIMAYCTLMPQVSVGMLLNADSLHQKLILHPILFCSISSMNSVKFCVVVASK